LSHNSLQAFIDDPRNHHRVGSLQRRGDEGVTGRSDHLNVVGEQCAYASGSTLPRDDNLCLNAVLPKQTFLFSYPHGAMERAYRT
jgi:hypothetical protein